MNLLLSGPYRDKLAALETKLETYRAMDNSLVEEKVGQN